MQKTNKQKKVNMYYFKYHKPKRSGPKNEKVILQDWSRKFTKNKTKTVYSYYIKSHTFTRFGQKKKEMYYEIKVINLQEKNV